jgi:hypothetical protein
MRMPPDSVAPAKTESEELSEFGDAVPKPLGFTALSPECLF